MRAISRLWLGTALACGVAACGVATPSTLTTEPTFTGNVTIGGTSGTLIFTAKKTGEFIVTVTSLSPDNGATLTLQDGNPSTDANGNAFCVLISTVPAGLGKAAIDTQLPAGQYCIQFSDPTAALPRTESFQATVQHS